MFPVTITLTSAAQLNAVMAALALAPAAGAEPTTAQLVQIAQDRAETVQKAKDTTAGKSAKDAAAPGKTTAKVDAAPEKMADASAQPAANAGAESQASTAVTYDVVGKAITEKAKTDRAHVIATLAAFGVGKGPELKPEQYADFLKALG